MKPKRTTESAPATPTSAIKVEPTTDTAKWVNAPDKPAVKLVPGINVFCVDCQAFNARTRRCHLNPPTTNNSFTVMRGPIDSPKEEWCMQFKLRSA